MRLPSQNSLFALVFTMLYALLLARLMPFHELWFDETEPWLLALYSNSYAKLLQNKVYEGHPNLWYSLLFVVTRFTQDLRALQVCQFGVAVGFVFVFLRYAPFHWLLRILFCFGYYGLFEYGLISRLYALELLTTFLICALYPTRFRTWYLFLLILVVNAQTHLFGLFFSGAIGILLFSKAFGIWKDSPQHQVLSQAKRWTGILIWIFGCTYAVFSILRPAESSHVMLNLRALTRPWQAFYPIPHFLVDFWNSSTLSPSLAGYTCEAFLSLGIILFVLHCFKSVKRLFLPYLLLIGLLSSFFAFKYVGSIRHFGHFFLFTLAFTWLLYFYRNTSLKARIAFTRLQTFLFLATSIQLIVGAYATYIDVKHPFHPAKKTAAFLKEQVPVSDILVLEDDIIPSSIVAYYGKPILYLPKLKPSSFFQPGSLEKNELSLYQMLDWAWALAHKENRRVILVSSQEIDLNWYSLPVTVFARFDEPTITAHYFLLYQIDPLPLPQKDFVGGTPQGAPSQSLIP
ncbi:hypothetical protein [Rufibacter latericius]|uniref:Glycosyltransferase RgtA/B/C/D-like domain-containing protein n=1 Tax=Rufibacter latericius TaxID=2487040 RepID=A0A3M9MLK0_9BACT|nr:hypothetical protein [Rufibacter latericius]RNI25773.1 hypothetical protein EFB08_13040 [Rufibacter latericius]